LEFSEFFLTVILWLKPSWVNPELRGLHGPKFYIFTWPCPRTTWPIPGYSWSFSSNV